MYFAHLGVDDNLFRASIAVFRRQWDAVFDRSQAPRRQMSQGATPGTLQGSGATLPATGELTAHGMAWSLVENLDIGVIITFRKLALSCVSIASQSRRRSAF